jgi:pimeloyl-ACP methyl ester carboxylesterase
MVPLGDRDVFVRAAPARTDHAEDAVFVHGLAGSATNWTDLMDELADLLDGVAVDLPGFGESPPPTDRLYSIDAHARAVVRLIEVRGGGPVHLFGNSLGGAVTTRIAAARPDLVRTLTLISPALPDLRPRLGPARVLATTVPGIGPRVLRRIAALSAEQRVQATLDVCFADPSAVHPDRLMELVAEVRRRDALEHTAAAVLGSSRGIVNAYFRRALWRSARRVFAPTLVIYGRDDQLVDPRQAAHAAREFPNSRVVVLPEVGHVAQIERPAVVAREFRAMLEDIGSPPMKSRK